MATLRDIKRRIKGVKNTQQITKAMKMVAAARLRRAQENIINARPYSRKISSVLGHLLKVEGNSRNVFFEAREVKRVALVVVTSDRGMCGSFNMNVIRNAEDSLKGELKSLNDAGNVDMYCIGKKGNDYFTKNSYNVVGSYPGIFAKLRFEFAVKMVSELSQRYINGEVDKIIIGYNEFRSVMQQKFVMGTFLPVEKIDSTENAVHQAVDYIYEPDKQSIINSLLPRHLKAMMWKILLESYAAELGARMTAMDMATENAKELIRILTVTYNKERQAAITKEILEIVSGANALKKS
ncbi:MAG: ATP synthase F1 subunit gamma [bacterium]